jgi:hypothetical protein
MSAYSKSDDILARAVAEFRKTPIPLGPSRGTMGRTLAALRAVGIGPQALHSHGNACVPEDFANTPGSSEKR